MLKDFAAVDILFHCFYIQMGVTDGHPILSIRWPLTPMPEKKIGNTYYNKIINIGTTNTILIRDTDLNIIFDPGILQLCRYGAMVKRLSEFNLKPDDIDNVVNSHCHYDHIESNHIFMEKPLIIHEKEFQYCDRLYWPEFRGAFIDIMDVQPIKGSMNIQITLK